MCFVIGEKMYCMTNLNPPFHVSLKASPEDFAEFTQREGVIPAPYLARAKWVLVSGDAKLSLKDSEQFIKNSYNLVISKLSKKQRSLLQI